MTTDTRDRAADIRAALRRVIADRGFHGASMGAVAREAGVATGTAYVHYASKDDVVIAAYVEAKRDLGAAAVAAIPAGATGRERFLALWRGAYDHLADDPHRARFLVQVTASPYAHRGTEAAMADSDDPFVVEAARDDVAGLLADLPAEVLYDLGLGPAVRLAANEVSLDDRQLDLVAAACWAAITTR